MKSQASATTLVGGGRRAPGSEHRSCHTNSVTASTINGGRTTCNVCRAISATRSSAGRRGGRKVTISALVPDTGQGPGSPRQVGRQLSVLPASRHLLDLQRREIGLRIGRIEHLAVEEGFLAARRALPECRHRRR